MPHPSQTVIRFVDAHSVNCCVVLQGMVPSMLGKCLFYAHDSNTMHMNCVHLIQELTSKDYPQSWWLPILRGRLTGKGIRPSAIKHIIHAGTSS